MKRLLCAALLAALLGVGNGCQVYRGMAGHGNGACSDGSCATGGSGGGGYAGAPSPCGPDGYPPTGVLGDYRDVRPQHTGLLSALSARGTATPPRYSQPAPPPSAAAVSYPYYTTRGPRDFLAHSPRGIGP